MNGVDYASKFNRQREIHQRNINDTNRNHAEQVEHLKETHEVQQKKKAKAYSEQRSKLEKGYEKSINEMRESQAAELKKKNREYELTTQENVDKFHTEREKNHKEWNRKFSNLKSEFDRNITQTKQNYEEKVEGVEKNYNDRFGDIRQNARKDLDGYINTVNQRKSVSNEQHVVEKEQMRHAFDSERNNLIKQEQEKRNFILENAAKDIAANTKQTEKNYLRTKTAAENRFSDMITKQEAKIDNLVGQRENRWNSRLQESEIARNREFSKRYEELSSSYDKNIRDIQLKNRNEKLTRDERNKELESNYHQNLAEQFQAQKETLLEERKNLIKNYDKRIEGSIDSYQENIRKDNITHAGQMSDLKGRLAEEARKKQLKSDLHKERIVHESTTRLKYLEDKDEDRRLQSRKLNERKVANLKKDFAESMEKARQASMRNFEKAKNEMIREKREMAKRIHEQNSKQSAYLKETHSDNIEKMKRSYEKRIAELELQNKMISQNANDAIQDIMRKTAIEIDRQREVAVNSAENEVRTERQLSQEKVQALQKRIDKIQYSFNEKINEQTLSSRKRLKDIHFELSNKLVSESNRYQSIIDQNNKFFARELQRLQMASSSERERLVTQYEGRISQLKKAYAQKIEDMKESSRVAAS